jgi:hypothetical protein
MSNGPPPAHHVNAINAVDAQWLFPLECTSPPPRYKGCLHNGTGKPTHALSPGMMSHSILLSTLLAAMTLPPQATSYPGSSFGFLPNKDHVAALRALDESIAATTAGIDQTVHCICIERGICNTCLDAILAAILCNKIAHSDSSCSWSPASHHQLSAPKMTPVSLTKMLPSSPPSHPHPPTYEGAVLFTMEGALRQCCQSSTC